tara:strand:- start:179 stop:349 length:171 start_codon:yes stop_codon:yes gene_type:complete
MDWPQIVMIALFSASLAIGISKHGESSGKHNAIATFIACAIQVWLLWAGGFWGGCG